MFPQPSNPLPDYPAKLLERAENIRGPRGSTEFFQITDPDLRTIWDVLRRFCSLVNLGRQIQRSISPELIQQTMIAVTYRLMYMNFDTGLADEVLRLGLLVFSHHVFLQWQDIKLPYPYLPTTYRNCIMDVTNTDGTTPELSIWLLMIGAISLYNASEEEWLRDSIRHCAEISQVRTWKEMQETLKSYLWIDMLHESPGKRIYYLIYSEKGDT